MFITKSKRIGNGIIKITKNCFIVNEYPFKFNNKKGFNKIPNVFKFIPEINKGIEFTYKNFIFALKENDQEYLEKICEQEFANKIKQNIKTLENNTINTNFQDENDPNIKINIISINPEVNFFISASRKKNKENKAEIKSVDKLQAGKFKLFNYFKKDIEHFIKFYECTPHMLTIVLRLLVDIETNLILVKDKKDNNNKKEFETHHMIIEAETDDPSQFAKIINSRTMSFLLFSSKSKNESTNFDWKMSDFDDFMKGNPLI
jgi:hypothetical protein